MSKTKKQLELELESLQAWNNDNQDLIDAFTERNNSFWLLLPDLRDCVCECLNVAQNDPAPREGRIKDYADLLYQCDHLLALDTHSPNQCDGCNAGIPVVDGLHDMGRPARKMVCQKEKYKG